MCCIEAITDVRMEYGCAPGATQRDLMKREAFYEMKQRKYYELYAYLPYPE